MSGRAFDMRTGGCPSILGKKLDIGTTLRSGIFPRPGPSLKDRFHKERWGNTPAMTESVLGRSVLTNIARVEGLGSDGLSSNSGQFMYQLPCAGHRPPGTHRHTLQATRILKLLTDVVRGNGREYLEYIGFKPRYPNIISLCIRENY